jgi:hypothetical protein
MGNSPAIKTIGLAAILTVASSSSLAQNSAAMEHREFGQGMPETLEQIPPGIFRAQLNELPTAAQKRALEWLQNFHFTNLDLPFLRADSGGGIFFEDPIHDAQDVEQNTSTGESSTPEASNISEVEAFSLNSKAGASRTVYLDMDGHNVTGTIWNNNQGVDTFYMRPYDTDGNEASFSQSELNDIAETWKRVAEDFAPYDINVTTQEPANFGPDVGHILVTRKADANGQEIYSCGCGGVAYVNVWGRSNYPFYQPALVFLDGVGGPHNISEAASHELGHNLALGHDGTSTSSYYGGHGSGNTDWGPIMGVGYYAQVSQWSKGEYADASNTQDDLQIIAGHLGYRIDDHEDVNFGNATVLQISNGTDLLATNPVSDPGNLNPANKGIIEDRNDIDLFSLNVGEGQMDIAVTPAWISSYTSQSRRGMNLDAQAILYDANGFEIIRSDIAGDTYAQISTWVAAGQYFLAIEGVGAGDPATTGYSNYGSLGQYFITGTVPQELTSTEPPTAPTDLAAQLSGETSIQLDWSDPASTPESDESGYRVYRSMNNGAYLQIANVPRNGTTYADNNLASGDYRYYLQAYNGAGSNDSNETSTVSIVAPSRVHAGGETSVSGTTEIGSYLDTTVASGYQRLVEQHQGGKPRNRVSRLEHYWHLSGVNASAAVTLTLDAEAEANSEGDNFEIAYAINGGSFNTLATLENGTGRQTLTLPLPSGTSGNVDIRVTDTDRTTGNGQSTALDVFYLDITSSGEPGDQMPVVSILSPGEGSQHNLGSEIAFAANATDPEDDDQVVTNAIGWHSDNDGNLGSGPNLLLSNLSAGAHTITAQTTDSAGNIGSDFINLIIVDPNAAVLAVDSMTPGSISLSELRQGASFTISGAGFDADAQITFANGSGPAPVASNVQVLDDENISLDISIGNGGPNKARTWDVVVTNPDGSSAVCTDCLQIVR